MGNVPHARDTEQAPESLVTLEDPAARLAHALSEQVALATRELADQLRAPLRQSLSQLLVVPRAPVLDLAGQLLEPVRTLAQTLPALVMQMVPRDLTDPRRLLGDETRRAIRLAIVSRAFDDTPLGRQALESCLRTYFSPRFLYPKALRARWHRVVRPRLEAYARAHGLTVDEAWRDVAVPALWLALRECGGAGDQAAVAKVMRRHLEAFLGCGELAEVLLGVELASELDLDAALLVIDLEQALAQLDERDRALALMKLRGHRAKEIAEWLGMTPTAVDMRWSRLRRQLEQWLA